MSVVEPVLPVVSELPVVSVEPLSPVVPVVPVVSVVPVVPVGSPVEPFVAVGAAPDGMAWSPVAPFAACVTPMPGVLKLNRSSSPRRP